MNNITTISIVSCLLLAACNTDTKEVIETASKAKADAGSTPTIPPSAGVSPVSSSSTTSTDDVNTQQAYISFLPPKPCGVGTDKMCDLGNQCGQMEDCQSGACDYTGKCIAEPSCVSHNGGDTCSAGTDSCCATDTLPSGVKMDRYKTTAGRMRAFITATQGKVQQWYQANKASLSAEAVSQIDPYVSYLPSDMEVGDYSVVAQLSGALQYETGFPSDATGCNITSGAGTHTYWFPLNEEALYGQPLQGYPQEYLDTLYQNCIAEPLAAAFCAWAAPGGRLQSMDDNNDAYGLGITHAWDNAGGYGYAGTPPVWQVIGPATGKIFDLGTGPCPTCPTEIINWANSYYGTAANPNTPNDYSYWISPPGYYAQDIGPYGTKDIAGTDLELTGTVASYTDPTTGKLLFNWGNSGSWQGHPVQSLPNEPVMTVYGMAAPRCVRD